MNDPSTFAEDFADLCASPVRVVVLSVAFAALLSLPGLLEILP